MIIQSINYSSLHSLIQWLLLGIGITFYFYAGFHAILYDDAKSIVNKSHNSFRSIHIVQARKISFGLPVPIFSKPENSQIKKYKYEYNKIILVFWIVIIMIIISSKVN